MGEPDDGWSRWPAPAKLNLFLRVLARRSDGYHDLQTAFRLLDWGDEVRIRLREDSGLHRMPGGAGGIPEADDLIMKAARLLQERTGSLMGADLGVVKRIPMGGGFGGGSSDAATVLVALDTLWQTRLGEDQLAELGLQLGSDVPVFVRGRNAWAEGRGERLTPVGLPPAWYVLAAPPVHVSTAELFQAPELTRDAAPATIADLISGVALGNAFEPVLRRREPAVDSTLAELARHGQARLTGSGCGCFIEVATQAEALRIQSELPRSLNAWVAAGADESALLGAVRSWQASE